MKRSSPRCAFCQDSMRFSHNLLKDNESRCINFLKGTVSFVICDSKRSIRSNNNAGEMLVTLSRFDSASFNNHGSSLALKSTSPVVKFCSESRGAGKVSNPRSSARSRTNCGALSNENFVVIAAEAASVLKRTAAYRHDASAITSPSGALRPNKVGRRLLLLAKNIELRS